MTRFTCINCGGHRCRNSASGLCINCARAKRSAEAIGYPTCIECGGRRSYYSASHLCRACYKAKIAADAVARRKCVECGGPTNHDPNVTRCWNCYRADQREKDRESREAFTEDVRWLLDCGTAPVDVCARMGVNAEALARRLRRYGERTLAQPFERLRNDLRRAAA